MTWTADNYRRYPGSISLYQTTSQRPPVFLQRNLKKALNAHQDALSAKIPHPKGVARSQRSSRSSMTATLDEFRPRRTDLDMRRDHVPPWRLPTKGMLQDIIQGHSPILTIEPRGFVKKGTQLATKERDTQRATQDLPWLPAPDELRLRCIISCSITESDEGANGSQSQNGVQRQVFFDNRKATVTSVVDEEGDCDFKIEMENAFRIGADSLASVNGSNRKMALRIAFSCANPKDAFQLLCSLDPDVESHAEVALSPERTELRCQWGHLPDCPTGSLTLRRYEDLETPNLKKHKKRLEYRLDALIAWNSNSNGTVLESYNRARIKVEKEIKVPTASPRTLPMVKESSNHRVVYVFFGSSQEKRSVIKHDLRCIFCLRKLPQSSFERLHFHYLAHHDHFRFKVSVGAKDGTDLCDRRLAIDLAEPRYVRASDNVKDEREITWIMPGQPFDMSRYLREEGENTWASGRLALLKPSTKIDENFFSAGDGIAKFTPATTRPPTEVQDLPPRKRKRYTVPPISGVTVYRSTMKRHVEIAEELSESDDDVEQPWLETKHSQEDFPNLSTTAREFATLFDEFFQHERISGDCNIGPTLVRFTRIRAKILRKPHILREFKIKLEQLTQANLVSKEYMAYCLEHVQSSTARYIHPLTYLQDGDMDVDMLADERVVDDSEVEAEAGAELSPTAPKRTALSQDNARAALSSYEVCVCKKPALGVRGVISCTNQECLYADFHLSCVGLPRRTPGWYCPHCRPEQ